MAGKTIGKYTLLTFNSQVVAGWTSITGVGYEHPEVDLTDMASTQKLVAMGVPACKVVVKGFLNNTATTGTHTLFTAAAALGSQVGVPLLVAYGILATATTGDPQFSNTLMSVSNYTVDVSGPNSAVEFTATLVPVAASVMTWGTKS